MENQEPNFPQGSIRSMIADLLTKRHPKDETGYLTEPPKCSKLQTYRYPPDNTCLRRASEYANFVVNDPKASAYMEKWSTKEKSIYQKAIDCYLDLPEILDIDCTQYRGRIGDKIQIKLLIKQDHLYSGISITIFDKHGEELESGGCIPGEDENKWEYITTLNIYELFGIRINVCISNLAEDFETTSEVILV